MLGTHGDSGVICVGVRVFDLNFLRVATMAHLVEKETLLRANSAMILTLIGGGLLACALGAVIFDIGRAVGVW